MGVSAEFASLSGLCLMNIRDICGGLYFLGFGGTLLHFVL